MDINADEALSDLASQLAITAKAAAIQAATVSALRRENESQAKTIAEQAKHIAELEESTDKKKDE